MAGNAIATAWIQVLPSLDGLQAALVKQSAGAVLTPKVMPAASSGKLFSTAGSMFAGLFNNNFGKATQTGLAGAFQRGLGRITGQFQSLGKSSASSFATGFSGYIGAGGLGTYLRLGATGAAIGVLSSTVGKLGGQIVTIGNAWGRTNAMIQNAVGDTANWRDMLSQTLDSANEIGVTVQELAESSSRLVTLAPATIPDYETAVKFSSLLSKNMIATGASTQEANAAMRQVTQALGKGVVNGDELTSIMENAPQIAQYLADELNVSVGELKQLGKEGKISGDALKNAVLNNADAINEAFEKMPITADRAFNQITNDIQVSMSEAAIAISQNLGNGLRAISSSGIADSIGNGLAGLIPLTESVGNALKNIAEQFAPAISEAFSSDNISGVLQPLTDMFDRLSQMSFDEMASGLQQFGTIATIAFVGLSGGVDGLIGRIPLVGRALLGAKNAMGDLMGAGSAAFGEILNATGKGVSGLGRFVESLSSTFDNLDRVNRATTEFHEAVEGMDFSRLGSAGDGIRQVVDELNQGKISVKDAVKQINDGLSDVDASKLPKGFETAFEKIQNIAASQGNGVVNNVRNMMTRVSSIVGELTATAGALKLDVQLKEGTDRQAAAELRSLMTRLTSELTGIRIPDFLSPYIGSMVATSVNEINAIVTAARNVGAKAGALIGAGLNRVGINTSSIRGAFGIIVNQAKATGNEIRDALSGSRLTSGVNSMVNAFTSRFPRIGQAAKSAMNIVRDTIGGVQGRFGSLANAAQTAFTRIASGATKIAGKAITGMGKGLSAVSRGFGSLGRIAGSLGVTGALMTGLTSGIMTLWNTNPEDLGDTLQGAFTKLSDGMAKAQTQLPAIASALSASLPQLVSTVVDMLPGLVSAIGQVGATLGTALLDNMPALLQAFTSMFDGLVQQIPAVLPGFISGFTQLIGMIAANIPGMMSSLATVFALGLQSLGQALPASASSLAAGFGTMFMQLSQLIPQYTSLLAQAIPTLVNGLAQAITTTAPLLMTGVSTLITSIVGQLPTLLPVIIQGVLTLINAVVAQLPTLITTIITLIPQLLTSIVNAIVASVPVIVNGLTQLMSTLVAQLPTLLQTVIAMIPSLLTQVATAVANAVPIIVSGVVTLLSNLVAQLPSLFQAVIGAIPGLIVNLADAVISNAPTIISGFGNAIIQLASALPGLFVAVIGMIPGIVVSIASGFADLGGRILGYVKDIPGKIKGVFSGAGSWLVNAGSAIINGFLNGLKSAWNGVTSFIGGIGDWIAEHKGPLSYDRRLLIPAGKAIMGGLSEGLQDSFRREVQPVIRQVNRELEGGFDAQPNIRLRASNGIRRTTGAAYSQDARPQYTGVTIEHVTASPLSDVDLVARRFGYSLNRQMIGAVRP